MEAHLVQCVDVSDVSCFIILENSKSWGYCLGMSFIYLLLFFELQSPHLLGVKRSSNINQQ